MKILNINNFNISKIFLLPPYKNEDNLISNINYDNEDFLLQVPSTYLHVNEDNTANISLIGYRSNDKLYNLLRLIEDLEDYLKKSKHFSDCNLKLKSVLNEDKYKRLNAYISYNIRVKLKEENKKELVKMNVKLSVIINNKFFGLYIEIVECLIF